MRMQEALNMLSFLLNSFGSKKKKEWVHRKRGSTIRRINYVHPSSGELYYLRMLLNTIPGPKSFEEIRSYRGDVFPTYKAACYARGLLDGDKEWIDALQEAARWATPTQLRQLFTTILMFCEVGNPYQLWITNWKVLGEDIAYRKKQIFQFDALRLSDEQIQNYTLFEIQRILNENGKCLSEFEGMPLPSDDLMKQLCNSLILEETSYDTEEQRREHELLSKGLNSQQQSIYEDVLHAVYSREGGLFFLYGHGGTGKTYVYRTLIAKRSEKRIVLAVASSGIASLLLPGGRTAHSRFRIPIKLFENSTCDIKHNTQIAYLIEKSDLIIWDEAPMAHKFAFEAVDRSFRDILTPPNVDSHQKPFGGKTVLLGGDFRQILPVVPGGNRQETVLASLNRSYLWDYCRVYHLTKNMRVIDNFSEFTDWILQIGEGKVETAEIDNATGGSQIKIPSFYKVQSGDHPFKKTFEETFLEFETACFDEQYLKERAILTPRNDTVDEINAFIMTLLPRKSREYLSSDSICSGENLSEEQQVLYPAEFLNTLKLPGIPNHRINLTEGAPIMLLRNVNQKGGLCNGTRLIITQLRERIIEAKIMTGSHVGERVLLPRIIMTTAEGKWPFTLRRRQFPVRLVMQ